MGIAASSFFSALNNAANQKIIYERVNWSRVWGAGLAGLATGVLATGAQIGLGSQLLPTPEAEKFLEGTGAAAGMLLNNIPDSGIEQCAGFTENGYRACNVPSPSN